MEALLAAAQSNPSPGQGQRNLCSLREYSQCHLPKDKPLLASSEQLQQYRTKSTKRGPVLVWNVGREAEPSPAQLLGDPCTFITLSVSNIRNSVSVQPQVEKPRGSEGTVKGQ